MLADYKWIERFIGKEKCCLNKSIFCLEFTALRLRIFFNGINNLKIVHSVSCTSHNTQSFYQLCYHKKGRSTYRIFNQLHFNKQNIHSQTC